MICSLEPLDLALQGFGAFCMPTDCRTRDNGIAYNGYYCLWSDVQSYNWHEIDSIINIRGNYKIFFIKIKRSLTIPLNIEEYMLVEEMIGDLVPHTVTESIRAELESLISEGKKIEAIKKYRRVTGSGLKESKEYVDSLSEQELK